VAGVVVDDCITLGRLVAGICANTDVTKARIVVDRLEFSLLAEP